MTNVPNLSRPVAVIVDVQGKLAQLMHARDELFAALQQLIKGMQALSVPILWTEQNPDGLGPTVPEVAGLLGGLEPIPKFAFSCWADTGFRDALLALAPQTVFLAGIETHICVYQTARDLLSEGYDVQVVEDAVSSRSAANRQTALARMRGRGAQVTCVEMALFELLGTARDPRFRDVLRIIK